MKKKLKTSLYHQKRQKYFFFTIFPFGREKKEEKSEREDSS